MFTAKDSLANIAFLRGQPQTGLYDKAAATNTGAPPFDMAGGRIELMSISQTLFDAIHKLEAELKQPDEYGPVLAKEIADLVERMRAVQGKLDQELTEIEKSDD
jgi:hypothetical protein